MTRVQFNLFKYNRSMYLTWIAGSINCLMGMSVYLYNTMYCETKVLRISILQFKATRKTVQAVFINCDETCISHTIIKITYRL